ncbi:MAG: hypothetical protein AAF766_21530 [Cyanobacteria bacterium P01_D01_bin.14]
MTDSRSDYRSHILRAAIFVAKKIVRFLKAIVLAVWLLGGSVVVIGLTRPDLQATNPIYRQMMSGRSSIPFHYRTELIPKPFTLGTSEKAIRHRLHRLGFRPIENTPWSEYYFETELAQGSELYRRETGTLYCNAYMYVAVTFEAGKLTKAGVIPVEQGCW